MRILSIDLGKHRSVACRYDPAAAAASPPTFQTLPTTPHDFHDLIVAAAPDRLVIETGPPAGWVHDLARSLGVGDVQVANPNGEAWRWRNLKRKTDRDDALKLAELSAAGQLPLVHVPAADVRQWRNLIAYRHRLVRQRTRVKNAVRAILHGQGLTHPARKGGWTRAALATLDALARPLADCDDDRDLWRGQLHVELARLRELKEHVDQVTDKLDAVARAHPRVALLRTMPAVGPRLAELLVATIDDPHRFQSARQVGAYAGLVPRQFQSGDADRKGRITRRGNPLLRALLVEVSWLARRHNPWLQGVHDRVTGGSRTRKKIAIVAAARRVLVVCWAMMRDDAPWHDPAAPGTATTAAAATPA